MIEIIPAIDIIGGECVRLTQGDYAQKQTYYKDPLDAARQYADAGIRRLHMVDLDGARQSKPANLAVLERVAAKTNLEIQYGGGIKSSEALQSVLSAGARRAICGSIAVTEPETFRGWLHEFGGAAIILGADVREGHVATHGWLSESELTAEALIEIFLADGLQQVICTEISRDGMLTGPAFDLYAQLYKSFPALDITASGGISAMDDIRRLDAGGVCSVIVGKAIYEGCISLEEIKKYIQC
ncbi:MAG: 1-(5-phosphoribosyl)-5-[(5-phosphoribosylamino)methylideneamino]imidazole-4-carboxamide isomerase [Rikenellaceae bacterium]|jgi:phosphoribosylformimino-5-aminoimidazole carboxamide ribotide isomerase|nr:1-(5-phosphoribosyl)-5-[(5-phosphoribosylamino)methylideneamino]imidazole-4-carboxamide isomerase [Rikenellaceae bacterium]